ncbi:hypothetical protein SLEP1_g58056 [Rubroshorea leprosula]|uniref:Uncharacterized protein n=1 Tax=Rubroshorea leprosula TaxID=152421 RepID=A0AAV5MP65_9ROSI|nr:hypothetical protein SLEP1_g58056 [Rubroshorea leprosula]
MEGGGAGAQPADTEMAEAAQQRDPQHPQQHPAPQMVAGGMESIPATLSHSGRFIQYNIFGNMFEVTAKYKPPITPISKGAYGIVCFFIIDEGI